MPDHIHVAIYHCPGNDGDAGLDVGSLEHFEAHIATCPYGAHRCFYLVIDTSVYQLSVNGDNQHGYLGPIQPPV